MPRLGRREALGAMAAALTLPLISGGSWDELLALARRVRAAKPSSRVLQTLDENRSRTVELLAEIILPATDTAGATDVGVTEFIDLLLTDWLDDEDRDAFLAGIDEVDATARAAYGTAFADCSEPEQVEMVTAMDAELAAVAEARRDAQIEATAAARAAAAEGRRVSARPPRDTPRADDLFFYHLKRFTLAGYFTSETGLRQLGYRINPGRWDPCVHEEA